MSDNAHSIFSGALLAERFIERTKSAQRRWCVFWTLCLVTLASCLFAAPTMAQPASTAAPLRNENVPNRIPDRYIVVFKAGTKREALQSAQDIVKRSGGTILFTYTAALTGFNAIIPDAALPAVRAIPGIDYIEADQMMRAQTSQPPNPNFPPPDGIDRIDQRLIVPNGLNQKYTYSETGTGVNVYVIDSGIYVGHTDFGGRAHWGAGADFSGETPANTDCTGHGTHVAGVIGGSRYGVAKNVTLYAVRVTDCNGSGPLGAVTQGVDWVMMNASKPAVANISLGADNSLSGAGALTTAVNSLVNAGVTVVVAAGNFTDNACNYTPSDAQGAIVVGATDPSTDQVDIKSNYGPCLKLFAPGVGIESAFPDIAVPPICTAVSATLHSRSVKCSGTSVAAPHVAGVAARYLQTNPTASPADVWNAIHAADDVATTMNWGGISGAGPNSPNELLHWGSLNNGQNDGDPHFVTVDGIKYDFQGAGEFVVLRDGNGLEIQTRQTPVATAPPARSAYTGLATCVSVNTAVAARVGGHRVTYQPNYDRDNASADLQLRVDGKVTALPPTGLDLGPGGRVIPLAAVTKGVIEIDFPDGTNLMVTPGYWQPQHTPYLNVDVYNTTATEGLMGATASGSWLPALPNGTSVGALPVPMPAASHQRFVTLYQTFGKAWRVTDATTLFDYASGSSTASFTNPNWPPENPPCTVPGHTSPPPLDPKIAQRLCSAIAAANRKADCIFDTIVTGDPGFAKTYLISQQVEARATTTSVNGSRDQTELGELVIFTATVRMTASRQAVTNGTVQFVIDGANVGGPLKLNARGQAVLRTTDLAAGRRRVIAVFIPAKGSALLASTSLDRSHVVVAKRD